MKRFAAMFLRKCQFQPCRLISEIRIVLQAELPCSANISLFGTLTIPPTSKIVYVHKEGSTFRWSSVWLIHDWYTERFIVRPCASKNVHILIQRSLFRWSSVWLDRNDRNDTDLCFHVTFYVAWSGWCVLKRWIACPWVSKTALTFFPWHVRYHCDGRFWLAQWRLMCWMRDWSHAFAKEVLIFNATQIDWCAEWRNDRRPLREQCYAKRVLFANDIHRSVFQDLLLVGSIITDALHWAALHCTALSIPYSLACTIVLLGYMFSSFREVASTFMPSLTIARQRVTWVHVLILWRSCINSHPFSYDCMTVCHIGTSSLCVELCRAIT